MKRVLVLLLVGILAAGCAGCKKKDKVARKPVRTEKKVKVKKTKPAIKKVKKSATKKAPTRKVKKVKV